HVFGGGGPEYVVALKDRVTFAVAFVSRKNQAVVPFVVAARVPTTTPEMTTLTLTFRSEVKLLMSKLSVTLVRTFPALLATNVTSAVPEFATVALNSDTAVPGAAIVSNCTAA